MVAITLPTEGRWVIQGVSTPLLLFYLWGQNGEAKFRPLNDVINEMLAVRMVTLQKLRLHIIRVALCLSDNARGTQLAHTLEYHRTSKTVCCTLP
ncbi:hypothetical protein TNIN_410911 [Trichonephila inaurata madagascariensis]|uniref:Uncharacterized protein n=1 Tax=Trichonephila inaurata madagascariensis TaxID=2747483 RepID=A0A8X7CTE6_9ARAC|nr:hypothetical protein TNIN_410911 [Trichonephila inaurata madagascariensis]